jgi:hypothetical protein
MSGTPYTSLPLRRLTMPLFSLRGPWSGQAVVHPQLATIQLLVLEKLHSLRRTGNINEICVSETSWLPSAAIDSYSHVNDVAHFAEEVAEILVGHLEGHVADEECLGWWVCTSLCARVDRLAGTVELDCEAAALEDLLVRALDGTDSIIDILVLDVAETGHMLLASTQLSRTLRLHLPLAETASIVHYPGLLDFAISCKVILQ